MLILGVILLIVGLVAHITVLFWVGVALIVVGALLLGGGYRRGTPYGGRYYW